MEKQPHPSNSKRASLGLLFTGGGLLLIDALAFTGGGLLLIDALAGLPLFLAEEKIISDGGLLRPVLLFSSCFFFLFGFPFIFIGVLALLIGWMIRVNGERSRGLTRLYIGMLTFGTGIAAYIILQTLVPEGSGDTEAAWMAGLTILCVGFPLMLLGGVLFIIGFIQVGRERPRLPPPDNH